MSAGTLTHRELTAHIRGRLRHEGIAAGCKMVAFCGEHLVDIYPRGGVDARFTYEEQRTIRLILQVNGLTHVMGAPIDVDEPDVNGPGIRGYMVRGGVS